MLEGLLDGIEALAALDQLGTVSEAAVRLRLTQSAVSKRLQTLQRAVGFAIVEPAGRRLRLTAGAQSLLERARPLLADLRALATPLTGGTTTLSLAIADSIAASWGPAVVAEALGSARDCAVELHAHRSVLVIESVRLGRYHVGLSTAVPAPDLIHYPVIVEPMVLVRAGLTASKGRSDHFITIEPGSATWRAVEPLLQRHRLLVARPRIVVESFSAALQMVKAGFGDGLVPLGLALEARLPRRSYRLIDGVGRPVCLLTRKTVHQLASFERLRDAIINASRRYFKTPGAARS